MMAGFQAEENLTGRAPKKMCEKFWTLSREDAESWKRFCRYLKERGLWSAKLIISDKSFGILEALGDFFPEAH